MLMFPDTPRRREDGDVPMCAYSEDRSRRRWLTSLFLILALPRSTSLSALEHRGPSPIALVGRWSSAARHPTAGEMTIVLSIAQTLRFAGSASVAGKPFWEYGGTVRIEGRQLVWHYDTSSIALPKAARTDVDDIVSVDAEQIVLRSQRSGALRTLQRVR